MNTYFARLDSPFADATWRVCHRRADVLDPITGIPLIQTEIAEPGRYATAGEAQREADRLNASNTPAGRRASQTGAVPDGKLVDLYAKGLAIHPIIC